MESIILTSGTGHSFFRILKHVEDMVPQAITIKSTFLLIKNSISL